MSSLEEEVIVKKKPGPKPKNTAEVPKEKVKPFLTRIRNNTALYEVYTEGGGVIPKTLSGLYSTPTLANVSITSYESTRRNYY